MKLILILTLAIALVKAKVTYETPLTRNRTAILISGQFRSGNLSWWHPNIKRTKSLNMFGNDDPPTPIATVLEFLIKPLCLYGGCDLFIYLSIGERMKNQSNWWDGKDPSYYEPHLGDQRVCELYAKHEAFAPETGNNVFCFTEYEEVLMNPWVAARDMWWSFYDQYPLKEEYMLKGFYDMWKVNLAAKEYSLASNIKYSLKVRTRHDLAIVKALPPIESLVFTRNDFSTSKCHSTIYYPNIAIFFGGGPEDSFNIGLAEDMDHLFDKYWELVSTPFVPNLYRNKHKWYAESWMMAYLKEKYHICADTHPDMWFVIIRLNALEKGYRTEKAMVDRWWEKINTTALRIKG